MRLTPTAPNVSMTGPGISLPRTKRMNCPVMRREVAPKRSVMVASRLKALTTRMPVKASCMRSLNSAVWVWAAFQERRTLRP